MLHPEPLPVQLTKINRTLVMGVVNVTPDSFSDGGSWFNSQAAIVHGEKLLAQGADILDVGGESTRPGAPRVDESEELRRVIPVITELARSGAVLSIDTTRASVAHAAVAAGAHIINDVSGGLADREMAKVAAQTGRIFVAMHWRGHATQMDYLETYDNVLEDVSAELLSRVDNLLQTGVNPAQIVLDPGLGFSKVGANNWPLLKHTEDLVALGFPLLVGASRKRFLGHLLAGPDGEPVPPADRDQATAAVSALAAGAGAWCVRVHDVAPSVAAVKVAAAWRSG